jgi:two-component system sensor histidine kinase MprB
MLAAEPGLPEPERREVLDRVVAQVAELGQLVASVTELARDESQPGPLGEVELHKVVEASLAGARRDWPQTVFTAELEPWPVAGGSPDSLQIAVRNLLDNAAKFGPAGVQVEVCLRAGELTVRDHGPGIAPADLPHVFDRFYRAPSARGVPGSGLGLSIVRQVAERHSGTVRAEAAPGGGTLIRFWLPVQAGGWANPAPDAALAGSAP